MKQTDNMVRLRHADGSLTECGNVMRTHASAIAVYLGAKNGRAAKNAERNLVNVKKQNLKQNQRQRKQRSKALNR